MSDADRLSAGASPGAGDILQLLLDGHARTKADLVHLTGLARSTVSSRVDALGASGLVMPAGELHHLSAGFGRGAWPRPLVGYGYAVGLRARREDPL